MRRTRNRRRGAVLITVLVSLVLLTIIGGALIQSIVAERKLLDAQTKAAQSRWLAEAGLQRAAARLLAEPQYAGESWSLAAEELAAGEAAVVMIEVAAAPDRPGWRRIAVQAEYPRDPQRRVRTSKQIEFKAVPSGDAP